MQFGYDTLSNQMLLHVTRRICVNMLKTSRTSVLFPVLVGEGFHGWTVRPSEHGCCCATHLAPGQLQGWRGLCPTVAAQLFYLSPT